jgi:N12 class adenine-specific DNA methylase/predicted RNA methylase
MLVDVASTSGGANRYRIRTAEPAPQGSGNIEKLVYSNQGQVEVVRERSAQLDAAIEVEPPMPPAAATDYRITDADQLGQGGPKVKFRDNVAALRLLQQLQTAKRAAGIDEQRVLVKYVGWGGIPQAFDHRNTEWKAEFQELASVLSKDEYEAARRSTQDAHYTPAPVINAIYSGLSGMGFGGGRILESSIGTGNFAGMMPEAIAAKSKITGVELDPVTAQIAKHLYPSASIINKGFQEVTIPSSYFDATIGNPPFGNQRLFDSNHQDISQFSIHNYFIAKQLDKVRESGITAVVVSSYFMDAADQRAREHIAERAHLLGAIRLPNSVFKQNAGAEVTTDIVFLQRAAEGETPDRSWVATGSIPDPAGGDEIPLNQYFIDHPEMLLGTMERINLSYRGGSVALTAPAEQDLAAELASAVARLPKGVYKSRDQIKAEELAESAKAEISDVPLDVKIGAYFVTKSGIVAQRLDDLLAEPQARRVEGKSERALERIKGMVGIRTQLRELMMAERTTRGASGSEPDMQLERMRNRLNTTYDGFVKKHGHITALVNKQAMSEDPDYPLLQSLERDYDKGISKETAKKHNVEPREPNAQKAAIFSRRVMSPRQEVTHVESSKDALVVSMNETGRVDMDLMVRLSGRDEQAIVRELQGLIYQNPTTQRWETADRYLTGNVKEKLALATAAAIGDSRYAGNVEALKLVQPADIEAVDISVHLGATWVPPEVVDAFAGHLFGNVKRSIVYQPSLGKWSSKINPGDRTTMHSTWGTARIGADDLFEAILANRAIEVVDVIGKDDNGFPIRKTNEAETAAAVQKADEIRQAFNDWIWDDKTRRDQLVRLYNDRFNTNVAPTYDGSHLTLPGSSDAIDLRISQKNAIWRGIQDGTELFDHVVGAGKTYACIGTAMESKRMGLVKKAMFVVPNHLLLQWKDDIYKLYPEAKVLIAEKTDFTKENRERLFARIATGDWDAVVIGHSSFKKIGMPQETLDEILHEQIDDLVDAISLQKAESGDRVTIKEMEKTRDRMEARLKRAAETGSKDKVVTFDELGVDALFVDEADEFKNLFITTSLSRISGLGNLQGSDKAFDLFVKARYLQKENNGRGVYFATGTPVANTIAEIYTMQRYMQYDELKRRGIHHFDAWASTFGEVVTGWELDATGVNYRLNSRFSKFQNVPELTAMYRTFADVITRADLERQAQERGTRFPVPKVAGGRPQNVVVDRSPMQAHYMGEQEPMLGQDGLPWRREDGSIITKWTEGSIIHRMENLPPDPSQDNPLKITNDARKAGLDFRLVDADAPDFAGSNTNAAVDEMMRLYQKWDHKRGVQLVFCDLSTPKLDKASAVVAAPTVEDDAEVDAPDPSEISMDELLSGGRSAKFSVYNDVREKLIARGVPAEEVRFIHEAKTDLQRAKLFEQVRRGDVRFLIGSTAKMGAGTNVQRLLVGLHHLDAPWRPRDLEQREGRIIRQGNALYEEDPDGFEVEVLRYATKQTYDSRMWQTIEYKAGAIEQFRKGDSLSRVIDDVAGEAANAAEMKAAATGNPLIFMQVQFSADLKKLEALHSNYKRTAYTLESRIEWLEGAEERAAAEVAVLHKEIQRRDANTTKDWVFTVGDRRFNSESKENLQYSVMQSMQYAVEGKARNMGDKPRAVHVGKFRGFSIDVEAIHDRVEFIVKGERKYTPDNLVYNKDDKFSVTGLIQRLDNFANDFEDRITSAHQKKDNDIAECAKAKADLGRPFAQLRELELARKNLGDVMAELRKMQDNAGYVSTWTPATLESIPAADGELFAAIDPLAQAHAEREAKQKAFVVAAIEKAAQDYLQAYREPSRSDEFFNREHERLFEDGGDDVHHGLVARIKTDALLAQAVACAPGKRFATEAMLDMAEAVTQFRATAMAHAKEAGFQPEMARRDAGVYTGKVIAKTGQYFIQDAGMCRAVLHHRDDMIVGNMPMNEAVRISYRAGHGMVHQLGREAAVGVAR